MTWSKEKYLNFYENHHKEHGERASGEANLDFKCELHKKCGVSDQSVLDYGCGAGQILPLIENKSGYIGVDIAKEAIRLAKEKNDGWEFKHFTTGNLDAKREVVVAYSVFTHTPDPVPCLKDIHRNMQDFGIIDCLFEPEKKEPGWIKRYSKDEWEHLLDDVGFEYEYVDKMDVSGYVHHYYKIS